MQVIDPPQRYIDKETDDPIEQIKPQGSRFEKIEVQQSEDKLTIMALESADNEVHEYEAPIVEKMLRGVRVRGTPRRRDMAEDLQDALELLGYTVLDTQIQQY